MSTQNENSDRNESTPLMRKRSLNIYYKTFKNLSIKEEGLSFPVVYSLEWDPFLHVV